MTALEVRRLFTYESNTGVVRWAVHNGPVKPGDVAGCLGRDGRWHIQFAGRSILRSRLVWLYMTGKETAKEIDHKNHNKADDRISNLREANRSQQLANRRQMGNNTSGYRGIYFDTRKQRWAARISIFGKRKRLGTYATPEEAFKVVDEEGRAAYGEFWYTEHTTLRAS